MTKAQATREAKLVLARMTSTGWNIHVWENMGWHWCLEAMDGHLTLSGNVLADGSMNYFSCSLSFTHPHAGDYEFASACRFTNPNLAVKRTLRILDDWFERQQASVVKLHKLLSL